MNLRQNSSELNNVGSNVQQNSEDSSNMLISSNGVVAAVLWRSGSENVISTGGTTEEKEEPCHLCFGYLAQILKEFTFVFKFVLEDGFAKGLSAKR